MERVRRAKAATLSALSDGESLKGTVEAVPLLHAGKRPFERLLRSKVPVTYQAMTITWAWSIDSGVVRNCPRCSQAFPTSYCDAQ